MRKIILVILSIACFYAFHLFAGDVPENSSAVTESPANGKNRATASFTGGMIIVIAIGTGYLARKIYTIRSASGQ